MLTLVSCDNYNQNAREDSKNNISESLFEEKNLKINYLKEKKNISSVEFDLYTNGNIDREKNEIGILDSNKKNILFTIDSDREDRKPGAEGIYYKTDALYVYNLNQKSFDMIGEFKGYYIIQGYLIDKNYIALGIKLGEGERDYTIFYGNKGNLNESYKGKNIWNYAMYPSLIKTNTGIMLLEPQIEKVENNDKITGVNLFKLKGGSFQKINLQIPSGFDILSTGTISDNGQFVNFWENRKDENAYFFLMDENGLKKIIPFPKKYRLINFVLSENKLLAIVQVGEENSHKILVYDLDRGFIYSNGFDYVDQIMCLPSEGKIIIERGGKLSLLEFKNNEMNVENVKLDEAVEILLTSGNRFLKSEESIILTVYSEPERFIMLDPK